MVKYCNISACSPIFSKRKCKCYAEHGKVGIDAARDQFCGYQGDDGIVYGCDAGCCGDGCPGQCEGVKPRPPESFITHDAKPIDPNKPEPKFYNEVAKVLLLLVVISTLLLVLRFPFKKVLKGHRP